LLSFSVFVICSFVNVAIIFTLSCTSLISSSTIFCVPFVFISTIAVFSPPVILISVLLSDIFAFKISPSVVDIFRLSSSFPKIKFNI